MDYFGNLRQRVRLLKMNKLSNILHVHAIPQVVLSPLMHLDMLFIDACGTIGSTLYRLTVSK